MTGFSDGKSVGAGGPTDIHAVHTYKWWAHGMPRPYLKCRAMPAPQAEQEHAIRQILKDHGRLDIDAASLQVDDDLYDAGMTSHASVNVMLAIESEFDIEFPDQMLSRGVFESIQSIATAVSTLQR